MGRGIHLGFVSWSYAPALYATETSSMPRPRSLSHDLLRTLVLLIEHDGDASKVADILHVNQPSMSKRLKLLQGAGGVLKRPWVTRDGKTWELTEEGKKVFPGIKDLVYRYEQLTHFSSEVGQPDIRFACGQQAVTGFVRQALGRLHAEQPQARFLVSTPRGRTRIEGVACGLFDLATVTHRTSEIRDIARRELHVETIARDRLALVCSTKSPWAAALEKHPKTKTTADALLGFPLILPGHDAGMRAGFDDVLRRQGILPRLDIRMEIGGWHAILAYVLDGIGAGIISEAAIPGTASLVVRILDPAVFPLREIRLICRYRLDAPGELDLSPMAGAFARMLKQAASKRAVVQRRNV